MLTTFNEVDMSAAMALRSEYRDAFEKRHGVKLGFMSFFVKAAVDALKLVPQVNAEVRGDAIVYKNHYDIGVAVETSDRKTISIRFRPNGSKTDSEWNMPPNVARCNVRM